MGRHDTKNGCVGGLELTIRNVLKDERVSTSFAANQAPEHDFLHTLYSGNPI